MVVMSNVDMMIQSQVQSISSDSQQESNIHLQVNYFSFKFLGLSIALSPDKYNVPILSFNSLHPMLCIISKIIN